MLTTTMRRRLRDRAKLSKRHAEHVRFLAFLGVLVAVGTALILMQRGVAVTHPERVLDCHFEGIAAHTHSTDCYDAEGRLVCPLPERELHAHDVSCYDESGALVCGKDEVLERHVHGPGCFTTDVVRATSDEQDSEAQNEAVVTEADGASAVTTTIIDDASQETITVAEDASNQPETVDQVTDDTLLESSEDLANPMPAQSFTHRFEDADKNLVLAVHVDAPEGALPQDSALQATWISPSAMSENELAAVTDAVASTTDGKMTNYQAVDISFVDAVGEPVEPAQEVAVTLTSGLANTDDQPLVVHVDDLTEPQKEAVSQGEPEPARTAEVLPELSERDLAALDMSLADDQISFMSKTFSTYVLAVTTKDKMLEATDGESYVVSVNAPAAAGVSQAAELAVEEILPNSNIVSAQGMSYEDYVAETERVLGWNAGSASYARVFDISIVNNGETVQPADGTTVDVAVELTNAKQDTNLSVVHFSDAAYDGDIIANSTEATAQGQSVHFAAEGFSVYVIINHEGEEEIVTPRVEFHFIGQDYATVGDVYEASPYNFVNTAGSYQYTQILKDGENLEMIADPPSVFEDGIDGAQIEKFFYGWYVVNATSDTSVLDESTGLYAGAIAYTWPDSNLNNISFEDGITISVPDGARVGDTLAWSIGNVSGTATLDSEGKVHVYLAPLYEDFYFVNFRKGTKEGEAELANGLVARKLIVFGSGDSTTVRIGDVICDSPDPKHLIFAGWETVREEDGALVRDAYYRTLDFDGNEIDNPAGSDGYYITVNKTGDSQDQLDLYPVFDEARWLYFNTGKSGNGASYVGASYRLTNNERLPEEDGSSYYFDQSFFETHLSTRPGYDFKGWYAFANVDSDGNIANIDMAEPVVMHYVDDAGDVQTVTANTKAIKVVNEDGSIALPDGYSYEVNGNKIFEVVDGKLRFYKALDDLTLFANWESKQVDYTVVYWLQNANDDGYTLMHYQTEQGIAGEQTAATEISSSSEVYIENKLKFCHLSTDQDPSQSGDQDGIQQRVIEGDGSTIVNVYYDRDVYTLRFDIGFAQPGANATITYTPMSSAEAAEYNGIVYGLVDGEYVALTPDGNGGYTYAGTETVRHAYNGYRYQETTGNSVPQYGVVNGNVVELTYETVTEYYLSRYAAAGSSEYTGTVYDANSNEVTNPVHPTTYYRSTRAKNPLNWLSRTTNTYTYDNGVIYENGPRYLRVENTDTNTSYTLGFINGAMQTVSNDAEGWYYNTQHAAEVSYSGELYKEVLSGTWRYYVSGTTGPNYSATDNWDNFLTNNQKRDLGTTNPFAPSEYNGTYTTTVSGTPYMVFYYDLTAKYGENIMDRYPGSQPVRRNGDTSYSFVGWLAQRDSYYNARLNTSIKGYFDTMSEDLILTGGTIPGYNTKVSNVNPDNYTAVTVDGTNTITGEPGITQEFRCRYTSLSNAKKYLYRIYLADPETLEYPSDPTDKFVITAGSGSNPEQQTPPTYHGYTLVDTKVLSSNGTESTPGSSYNAYAIPELTEAGVGTGMIMQFKFMPNEHTISYMYTDNTEVGPSATYYYDQSLAPADVYTDAAVANTPAGYTFAGWYENPDGIGEPFDFDTTMPDGNIILYAVYTPIRYKVQINPNGGEIDHIDHTGASYVVGGVPYATPLNREGDTGYNRSQATYINANYGTEISEYAISRKYVPISDAAAEQHDANDIYYYINTQYRSTDGSGLPSDCRNALYVKESELQTYYNFYRDWTQANIDGGYITGTTVLDYGTWKSLYVSTQKYRKLNGNESWTFLGWFKDDDTMPYNFADPVTGDFTLTAHWRLDGGYAIEYVTEYVMPDGAIVEGGMEAWRDPADETLRYADDAETEIYKDPVGLTKDGTPVVDDSVIFRGWALVAKTEDAHGNAVYTPLEVDSHGNITKYYNPSDPYIVNAESAGEDSTIYFQAIYQYKDSSDRRPKITNLTLDANTGYINSTDSDDLPTWDAYPGIDWINTEDHLLAGDPTQIVFGDIQSSAEVHLYQYATELTEDASGAALTDAHQFFEHPEGYYLLGFDDSPTEGDYVATYPADSVVAVTRNDDRTIYAVWEPMVYLTLKNETGVGDVTFTISAPNSEALEVVTVANGAYDRQPLSSLSGITLADGESITLAFPKGAEKDITISGTNTLGVGNVLVWNSSLELVEGETTTTYDTATDGVDITYSHNEDESDTHTLVTGEVNNTEDFSFAESLIQNKNAVTVTFTSRDNDFALVLDDNYPGGGRQEYDYAPADIQPDAGVPKEQELPSTSTRIGYEFQGWAYSPTATTPDFSASSPADSPWTIPDLNKDDGFFSSGYEEVGGTKVRTLYAVWKAKAEASHVYIYKDVPLPGDQAQEFAFTVNVSGTYRATGTGAGEAISANGTFALRHGEYAELHSENSTTDGYIRVTVTLYNEDGTRKKTVGGTDIEPIVITAQASLPQSGGTFGGTEQVMVSEAATTYYATTTSRLAQVNDAYPLILNGSVDTTTVPLEDVDGNIVTWENTNAGGTVVYTNTRQTHDIGVEKVLHSNTSAPAIFSFTASYELDGTVVDLGSFTVQSGTTDVDALKNIPAGAVLTITEATDTNDIYRTTTSSAQDATNLSEDPKTFSFTVAGDDTITFDNTLKSYPVVFRLFDQDLQPSINGMFNLASSIGSVGTDLYASASSTNPPAGVFYTSDTLWADTYTLTQTVIPTGYLGPEGPVTLTVTGEGIVSSDPANVVVEEDGDAGYIIKVINRATKTVTVKKSLVDMLLTSTRQFGFGYSYTPDGSSEAVLGDFTLAPVANGNEATYQLVVPINASVTVTEKTTGEYETIGTTYSTTVTSDEYTDADATDGASFTVDAVDEDGTILFTNTRKTQTVTVKKVFADATDGTEVDFTATVLYGTNALADYTVHGTAGDAGALTTNESGQVTFSLTHNQEQELTLPYGTRLVVSESAEGYVTEVVAESGAADEDTIDKSFTLTVTADDTIAFTNSKSGVPVVLKKTGLDSVTHDVVDESLGGAVFVVYKEDHSTVATGMVEGEVVDLRNLSSSDDNGEFFNGMLDVGTYYLHETEAPDGYYRLVDDLRMTVNADGSVTLYASDNTTTEFAATGDVCTVVVGNYCGYALPASGGKGTGTLTLLGVLLMACAGACMLIQRRA